MCVCVYVARMECGHSTRVSEVGRFTDSKSCVYVVLYCFCLFVFNRPGIWKDLKTMGSVSLFIFFITLLVLGRQVRSPVFLHNFCKVSY